MSKNEMLAKVNRALQIADGIQQQSSSAAAELVNAAERCRTAQEDLQRLLATYKPATAEGVAACETLLHQLQNVDCGEGLLVRILAARTAPDSMIHTAETGQQVQ